MTLSPPPRQEQHGVDDLPESRAGRHPALLAAARHCQNAGGSFRLIGATGTVSRVLTITGVGERDARIIRG
jgi:hypothetical protein